MLAKKTTFNEQETREKVTRLLETIDIPYKAKVQQIFMTILKLASETKKTSSNLKLISQTVKELRQAFKLFGRYRDARKVCIFGSARTPSDDPEYLLSEDVCKKITEKGFLLITGAGGGIMEAGNKGAIQSKSFGVNIELPFEQEANPYIHNDPKLITFRYFFTRKLTFVRETDATILFPGGFGTHDELFEILTLVQTGHCAPRPILLMSQPDSQYWEKLIQFLKDHLLDGKFISPEDLQLYKICKNADEAVYEIMAFFEYFNSIRYLDNTAIMRLNRPLSEKQLKYINKNFTDILVNGRFEQIEPGVKTKDRFFSHLHKLVFEFDRCKYGRLVELIYTLRD